MLVEKEESRKHRVWRWPYNEP